MEQTKKVPALRFPEFSGKWETKELGEILSYEQPTKYLVDSIEYSNKYKTPVLTAGKKFILGYTNEEEWIFINGLPVIIFDDFTTANKFVDFGFKAKSSAMKILKKVNNDVNIKFVYEAIQIINFTVGAEHKRYWISEYQFLTVDIPWIEEQNKIANFLTEIDNRIEKLTKKKQLLESYKKGIMQKVFSQKIRFKDDNGNNYPDWEVKEFDDIFNSISTKQYQVLNSDIISNGDFKVIDQGQKSIAGYSNDESKLFKNLPIIIFGDHTTILKYIDFEFIVGADGTKILKNKIGNLKFFYYFLSFNKIEPEGYKRHFSILMNIFIQFPSFEEQTKIANFLTAIDNKINQVSSQIDWPKKYKKWLLQKMFI